MTLPNERLYAINKTRNFLRQLLNREETPKVPKPIRLAALSCLRHYPGDWELSPGHVWNSLYGDSIGVEGKPEEAERLVAMLEEAVVNALKGASPEKLKRVADKVYRSEGELFNMRQGMFHNVVPESLFHILETLATQD